MFITKQDVSDALKRQYADVELELDNLLLMRSRFRGNFMYAEADLLGPRIKVLSDRKVEIEKQLEKLAKVVPMNQ